MGKLAAAIIPVTAFEQNCTLLWDDESMQGIVIDPGGDVERIVQAIGDLKVEVKTKWDPENVFCMNKNIAPRA